MKAPFRFRFSRLLAGILLIGCFLVVVAALLSGRGLDMFEQQHRREFLVCCELPQLDTQKKKNATPQRTLVPGIRVEVLGQSVGSVEKLWLGTVDGQRWPEERVPDAQCKVVGRARVKGDFARLVGKDSVIHLREDLAGFGGVYLDIQPGSAPLNEGSVLFVTSASSARTVMEELLVKLSEQFDEMVELIEKSHNEFLSDGGKLDQTMKTLADVGKSTKDLMDDSRQQLNSLVTEERKQKYDSITAQTDQILQAFNSGNLEKKFPEIQASLARMTRQLEATATEFRKAAEEVSKASMTFTETSEAAQKTWLLRGGMRELEKEKKAEQDQAAAVASGAPQAAKRRNLRDWLSSLKEKKQTVADPKTTGDAKGR